MQGFAQKLEHRQKLEQKQVQLQKQILRSELVQLPLLQLEARIKAELEENPFLEETDEVEENPEELADPTVGMEDEDGELPVVAEPGEKVDEVDWNDFLNDMDHFEYKSSNVNVNEERDEIPQPDVLTLADYLREQIQLDDFTDEEVAIAEEIIGNINPSGYLEVDLDEISWMAGAPLQKVEETHRRILSYEPVGIASRNLQECLLVQLQHRSHRNPVAERMIAEFWDEFVNKRYEVIGSKLGVKLNEIRDAFDMVAHLNPKPGEGYFDEKQNYVVPDLIVTQVGGEFEVFLNDGTVPNFRINNSYREMYLTKSGTDKKVKEFLSRKLESARWFLAAVYQRRTTMVRTMRAIVARQQEFFLRGQTYLKPMILADIAEDISMDISTISRVTNGKYVQTDWGVFELKYFFSERMSTDSGDDVSNRVIKGRLKDMIDNEDKHKPLSDQDLTEMLVKEGFQISRRTVAKYREMLRIPVQRLRREI